MMMTPEQFQQFANPSSTNSSLQVDAIAGAIPGQREHHSSHPASPGPFHQIAHTYPISFQNRAASGRCRPGSEAHGLLCKTDRLRPQDLPDVLHSKASLRLPSPRSRVKAGVFRLQTRPVEERGKRSGGKQTYGWRGRRGIWARPFRKALAGPPGGPTQPKSRRWVRTVCTLGEYQGRKGASQDLEGD